MSLKDFIGVVCSDCGVIIEKGSPAWFKQHECAKQAKKEESQ